MSKKDNYNELMITTNNNVLIDLSIKFVKLSSYISSMLDANNNFKIDFKIIDEKVYNSISTKIVDVINELHNCFIDVYKTINEQKPEPIKFEKDKKNE